VEVQQVGACGRKKIADPARRGHPGRVAEGDAVRAVGADPSHDARHPIGVDVALERAAELVATITSIVAPESWINGMSWVMSSSDSAVDRLRLRRLCVSLAETTTSISRKPAAIARWAPREFGINAE